MTDQDQQAYQIVRRLFKNDNGEPFEMTEGQIALFRAIYEKKYSRNQFECYTQYGKSDTVSMAVLLRAATFPEKWIILGGTKDKAAIIMGKLIKHIFENDYTLGKFEIAKDESMESVRRYKSKDHVSFRVDGQNNLGEVMILSGETKKKNQDAGDILIGHGAKNLIEDDAALIPDMIHGKAMRMLGGHKDNFLLKITNTFGRNHAFKSSNNPNYHKILINYEQGIKEGRITPDYVQEMRDVLSPIMFGVLYDCVYPPSDMVEEGDWIPLLTPEQIEEAQRRVVMPNGIKKLGGDIAEGGNYNSFVIRQDNYARVREKTLEKDLMKTAEKVEEIRKDERVAAEETFLDGIGVGAGVVSRCHQLGAQVNGIRVGEAATEKTKLELLSNPIEFSNLRAQITWAAKLWIEQGGALETHADWVQATKIRYKTDGGKSIKIMSKEMMRARGLIDPTESPDTWEAFTLTFAPKLINTTAINATASIPVLPFYGDRDLSY